MRLTVARSAVKTARRPSPLISYAVKLPPRTWICERLVTGAGAVGPVMGTLHKSCVPGVTRSAMNKTVVPSGEICIASDVKPGSVVELSTSPPATMLPERVTEVGATVLGASATPKSSLTVTLAILARYTTRKLSGLITNADTLPPATIAAFESCVIGALGVAPAIGTLHRCSRLGWFAS